MYTQQHSLTKYGPLAQLVEQFPFKEWVVGSSPTRLTIVIVIFMNDYSVKLSNIIKLHKEGNFKASIPILKKEVAIISSHTKML